MTKIEKILIKKYGKVKAEKLIKIINSKEIDDKEKPKTPPIDYKLENEKLKKENESLKQEQEFINEMENFETPSPIKDDDLETELEKAESIFNSI